MVLAAPAIRTMTILLTTLNARYSHASLGLRYLLANMGELQPVTQIQEFVIGARSTDIVEKILALRTPGEKFIVGFGVYIWNVVETTQIIAVLKRVAPDVVVILGGPEVSHETGDQEIIRLADYVVTGWGDVSFPALCQQILQGPQPLMKVHAGLQPPMAEIQLPYHLYSDQDIRHRTLYVEASRGCPFKCEFCLSALDKTAWPFDIDQFLQEMEGLYQRGARLFKFVDRTFNLNIKTSLKIMQFFLDKLEAAPHDPVYAHFEVVPDHLPDALKEGIQKFPEGSLQFEIGIQSFNTEVQALISRKQNNDKAAENIRWLCEHSHAHLHVDLIAGLPGETMESFAQGFNKLVALGPHEIQFGILKRLRGTPIIRHTEAYQLAFDPQPPYTILANKDIAFADMQRLIRFARYWDMIANSGRFSHSLPLILADAAFENFMALSDWMFANTDATHRIALDKLAALVNKWLLEVQGTAAEAIQLAMSSDYAGQAMHKQGNKSDPSAPPRQTRKEASREAAKSLPQRQARHMAA